MPLCSISSHHFPTNLYHNSTFNSSSSSCPISYFCILCPSLPFHIYLEYSLLFSAQHIRTKMFLAGQSWQCIMQGRPSPSSERWLSPSLCVLSSSLFLKDLLIFGDVCSICLNCIVFIKATFSFF